MTFQNSTFGFIDYFLEGGRQRIPCQFLSMGNEMMARLDPGGSQPILTAISTSMRAEVLGSFPAVLERYKPESDMVLGAENFWHECETDGGGALKFFQVVHHMRLFGTTVSQGLDAAIHFSRRLRASETEASREIYEIFAADIERLAAEGILREPGATADRIATPRSFS